MLCRLVRVWLLFGFSVCVVWNSLCVLVLLVLLRWLVLSVVVVCESMLLKLVCGIRLCREFWFSYSIVIVFISSSKVSGIS